MCSICTTLQVSIVLSVSVAPDKSQTNLKILFFCFWCKCLCHCETSHGCFPKPVLTGLDANHKGLPSGRGNKCWGYYMSPSSRPCSLTLAVLRRGRARWLGVQRLGALGRSTDSSPPALRLWRLRMSFSHQWGVCHPQARLCKVTFCQLQKCSVAVCWLGPWLFEHNFIKKSVTSVCV